MPYQPVPAQPTQGGDLITRYAHDNVGASNYVVKRDWRRVTDGEIRREGHIDFAPDDSELPADQSWPGLGEAITLIHYSRRPNGQAAVIVGTHTTLWRYFSFDDGHVYTVDVYDATVFEDLSGIWLKIGRNFGGNDVNNGHRWEAVEVAGKTVFNNGYDLPVVYDVGWLAVRPITELREQGIAFAETIAEFSGMLLLGDVAELNPAGLLDVMNGRGSGVITASQSGFDVTSGTNIFTTADVGKTIIFPDGVRGKITAYSTPKIVQVDTYQYHAASTFRIALEYGVVTDSTTYSRTQYRLVWSEVGDPLNFGLSIPATFSAGTHTIQLDYLGSSFAVGDAIVISGAGLNGSALITVITSVDLLAHTLTVAATVETDGSGVAIKYLESSSISGNTDLQDDGSAILRMIELQNRLIVMKGTTIFAGQFTGDATNPLTFQKLYQGPFCLFWKWMLVKINGVTLVYAGRNGFYTFDLSSLVPKEHAKLALCHNIFFDEDIDPDNMTVAWAATNEVTHEIWFGYSGSGSDKALCYDYRYNTCATVGYDYTAAATVSRPDADLFTGSKINWFLLGTGDGHLYTYGLTDIDPGTWTRGGSNYDSTIKSGLISYGDDFGEKDLRSYVVYFADTGTNPDVEVTINGTRNAHETPTPLFVRTIPSPTYQNLINTFYRKNYFQDQLRVTGASTNLKVVRRLFEVVPIDSRSTIRTP